MGEVSGWIWFAVQKLRLINHRYNCCVTAPPASCRSWRPLQAPNNNAEDDDVPDQALGGKILTAEVTCHIACVCVIIYKLFANVLKFLFNRLN